MPAIEEFGQYWLSELKSKREEVEVASKRALKWKKRAKAAEAERDELQSRLTHNETLAEECERLREELIQIKKELSGNNPEKIASQLSKYKERLKKAEAAQRIAEATCDSLRHELANTDNDSASQSERSEQEFTQVVQSEKEPTYSEVERKTDEHIRLALEGLPFVEELPASNM